jgi:hypothetical protein
MKAAVADARVTHERAKLILNAETAIFAPHGSIIQ